MEQHLAVNFFGTYAVTQAFLPMLTCSRGAIVNNVSLAAQGVRVHAVLTGPVDTEMTAALDIPKAAPESVARAIFDAVDSGEEDIFPDPLSASLANGWRNGVAKELERQNAAFVQPQPSAA